jgi:outer membrane protein assembly factor BamD
MYTRSVMAGRITASLSVIFLTLVFFVGCGGNHGAEGEKKGWLGSWFASAPPPEDKSEAELAREAMDYYARGRYLLAEEIFQKIKDRYPFSPYATLAELRLADCKFYEERYEEAIPFYEEFEKLHPTNEAVTYVIYQVGSCYHHMMASADRDQTNTRKVVETCERLIKRYPDSPYSSQAGRLIREARDRLAEHEIVVAKWYIRKDAFPQARSRLEVVLELYQDTPSKAKAQRLLSRLSASGETAAAVTDGNPEGSWWRRLIPFM